MRKYIGLHVLSILITVGATIFCGIFVVDFLTAGDKVELAFSVTFGLIFAVFGAIAYLIAMIFGAIGWGLSKRQGSSCTLFAIETILPIILGIAVFLVYLI